MIKLNEISSEWLNQVSKQHRNADKILAEKVTTKPFYLVRCIRSMHHRNANTNNTTLNNLATVIKLNHKTNL